jgi:uncharacterized protein YndB with AHSA1/START domain
MSKEFRTEFDATVDATPDQVWQAIATGPGISTWFVGRTEIDGKTIRTAFGDGFMPDFRISDSDEPRHFAHGSDPQDDGRFVAFDYLIEGRDHAATSLHAVASGFLPGDDWADEYEAMTNGNALFFATLVEALRHFPGRTGTAVTEFGPPNTDWSDLRPAAGETYFTSPQTLGVRTPDALIRYMHGFHGSIVTCTTTFEGLR